MAAAPPGPGSARVPWSRTARARPAVPASWPAAAGYRAASWPAGPVPRPARDHPQPRPARSVFPPARSPAALLIKPSGDDAGDPGAGLAVPQRRQLARVRAVVARLEHRRGHLGPGDQAVAP